LLEAPWEEFERVLAADTSNAICLVTPNNPTGAMLGERNFRGLLEFCKQKLGR